MEERLGLGQREVGLSNGVEDALGGLRRRGRRLGEGDIARLGIENDQIGKRTADVDGEELTHCREPAFRAVADALG